MGGIYKEASSESKDTFFISALTKENIGEMRSLSGFRVYWTGFLYGIKKDICLIRR